MRRSRRRKRRTQHRPISPRISPYLRTCDATVLLEALGSRVRGRPLVGMYVCSKVKNSQARTGHQRGMGGRWTDDDGTHERHTDTSGSPWRPWGWGETTFTAQTLSG